MSASTITDRVCAWLFDGARPPEIDSASAFVEAAGLLDELAVLGQGDPSALAGLIEGALWRQDAATRGRWARSALRNAGPQGVAVLAAFAVDAPVTLTDRLCAWLFDDAPAPTGADIAAAPAEALQVLDELGDLVAACVPDPQLGLLAEARLIDPLEDLLRAHLPADVDATGPRGAALLAERVDLAHGQGLSASAAPPVTDTHPLVRPVLKPVMPEVMVAKASHAPARRWPGVLIFAAAAAVLFFILHPPAPPTDSAPPPVAGQADGIALVSAAPNAPPSASDAGVRAEPLAATAQRPALRPIPAGTFMMGSPPDEEGRGDWEEQRQVTLTRAFYLARTEITQAQWQAVMGANPSRFAGRGRYPVENISWLDAVRYVNALSKAEGLPTCYRILGNRADFMGLDCEGYRLPTEAEWEYAARAGTVEATYAGDLKILDVRNAPVLNDIAWYSGNAGLADGDLECPEPSKMQFPARRCGTHPVATRRPNAFGLYDMIGNVWEWTHDVHGKPATTPVVDPLGAEAGERRVTKGCGWYRDARFCRAANRYRPKTTYTSSVIGMRPARTIR